jgi:CMP-N,N'-diacetyllegionaminic acid synthase
MYKKKKILALIPARAGSKGLPGKNIRPLMGKPLIAWSIENVLGSQYVDRIVVSTDSPAIAAIARKHGADVPFLRPKELSTDKASTIDAISHAVDYFKEKGEDFDYIALLEPTSPLRNKDDIDKAIKRLIDVQNKADSLVSVGQVHMEHPGIVKKIINGKIVPYCSVTGKIFRRQDLDKAYFPYGVIYLSKTKTLFETRTFYQKKTIPYFIERWQNYEVDDIFDFYCIEAVLKMKSKEKLR